MAGGSGVARQSVPGRELELLEVEAGPGPYLCSRAGVRSGRGEIPILDFQFDSRDASRAEHQPVKNDFERVGGLWVWELKSLFEILGATQVGSRRDLLICCPKLIPKLTQDYNS